MKEKNLKVGLLLISLGNLLYFLSMIFGRSGTLSDAGDFFDGLLLGISIAINIIGIILISVYVSKNKN